MIKAFSIFVAILLGLLVRSQEIPAIIQVLERSTKAIPQIIMRSDTSMFIGVLCPVEPGLPAPTTGRTLIRTNEALYVNINGSGRLYKISTDSGSIQYVRIDSTQYGGNGFGAIIFTYNNKILSLGGYGFWRANGQLREFRGTKDGWEPQPLNEEISISRGTSQFPWVDEQAGMLYLHSHPEDFINQSLKGWQEKTEVSHTARVMKLNLKTGDWHEEGKLESSNGWKYKVIANAPWGLLLEKGFRDIHLFDYRSNEIKHLSKSKADSLNTLFAQLDGACFFVDSTLYFGDLFSNTADSLQLSASDFLSTGKTIHAGAITIINSRSLLFLFGLLVSAIVVIFLMRKRLAKTNSAHIPKQEYAVPHALAEPVHQKQEYFTEVEKKLIHHVAAQAQAGKTTSIDDINRLLGVANKNLPSQKRTRSEALATINSKAAKLTLLETEFIQRNRAAIDGRQVEYSIAYDMIKPAFAWINGNLGDDKKEVTENKLNASST